ncbi:unnamed protein product [Parnassius apollo]|uniref:(apollo) hypothetical protein n=1 Tax=Parnassius apollo TaxID=110799 RepID=A0A8S3Y4B6_PARAO|nr:unnamed protein product [Parnassius apollo]
MDPILTDTTSPSLIDYICDTDLSSEINTNALLTPLPQSKLEYSDSDTENTYTLVDLDKQNIKDLTTYDPTMPAFINQLIQPSTSSLFDQQELNVSKNLETHDSITSIDSEDTWKPASSSSDSDEDKSVQTIEEETSVGKIGYMKIKPLPKRLLAKKNRKAAVGKSIQPKPCTNKKCGNSYANKFTEVIAIIFLKTIGD